MDPAVEEYFEKELDLDVLCQDPTDEYIKGVYETRAVNYDEVCDGAGYKAHRSCAEIFDSALEKLHGDSKKNLNILDAGAGTGIVGGHLKEMGYTNVDALDISQEMLNKAKEKNVYRKLICAPLCEEVISEITTGAYDATISVAAITIGHIKAPALDEMVRHVKPGGIICFSMRTDVSDNEAEYGYAVKMKELERLGKWELASKELTDYYANLGEERTKCYAITYKVIKSQ